MGILPVGDERVGEQAHSALGILRARRGLWRRGLRTWVILATVGGVLAARAGPAGGQTPEAEARESATVVGMTERERALEERVRRLEETNRKLLEGMQRLVEREERNREEAERRYRALEERIGDQGEARTAPMPDPAVPSSEGGLTQGTAREVDGSSEGGASEAPSRRPPGMSWERLPLKASFDDGFVFETLDEELSMRIHILDQTDFKDFLPNDQFPARSGIYIPRVRVYFEGQLTRMFDYEVSIQRSVEGVWDLLDANLDIGSDERFRIRFGRSLVPYSYDWYDHLEQYFLTPERGLFPLNFGLSRSAGLMAHGFLFDRRMQYAVGGFDGRLVGIADDNNTRDAVGYVNFQPFLTSERFPALRHLNVGASIFGGRQILPGQTQLPLRTSLQSSENDEAAQAASAVFLEMNDDVRSLGSRSAGAIHMAWYYRHLSVEAEWQTGRFQFARAGQSFRPVVPVNGFHAGMGYFLTGEEVEERTTVVPLRPLDLRRGHFGLGAIELFARYSQLELGSTIFTAGLADPDRWTRQVYMTDLGFNWYPNRFVKFYFDWQLPIYGSPVLVNEPQDRFSRHGNMFWVRCQLYY